MINTDKSENFFFKMPRENIGKGAFRGRTVKYKYCTSVCRHWIEINHVLSKLLIYLLSKESWMENE